MSIKRRGNDSQLVDPNCHTAYFDMATFNDLPNELIIAIIEEIVPYGEQMPLIGVDAAWDYLLPYRKSLKRITTPNVQIPVKTDVDLLPLRS